MMGMIKEIGKGLQRYEEMSCHSRVVRPFICHEGHDQARVKGKTIGIVHDIAQGGGKN